ncbi:NAD-dependent epimerase/dehydratase family protein [Saccharopolyspora sp. 6V]|uniref:NAD-dependent epimerase/dehydratase family protein n=1 Tax=Saccharopolyspora sp. 6V TaxID=2877239 RepID=UPI001CD1E698|nr:NAD-dependent epimerase/dehydratase family protein [Saccharopolyspora sp. 6V]MCA1192151.1 NAD-dependent epimerase/dehydratase family protein [Saccharopolyspora sp. 6V]
MTTSPRRDGPHVVVVGATGNIGTSVVAALAADPGVGRITGLARRVPARGLPGVDFARCDITRDDLARRVRHADAVIDLAWIFQPTHDPVTTWRNNVLGRLRLFEAVAAVRVPALLYASSVGAYSPGPGRTVDEDWPTDGWPGAAYTREKAYLERCLDAFEHRGGDTRIVRFRPGFVFKAGAAAEQRRLFGGPLVPGRLVRPAAFPAFPDVPGLRFQAVHSADLAEAFRAAVRNPVRGAFNVAADPVVDPRLLAEHFGTRPVRIPARAVRAALAAAWRLHLVPASPDLFDAVLRLPLMDVSRAREELGWCPSRSGLEAVLEMLDGLRRGTGTATPQLAARAPGGRWRELATGVGSRQ